MLFQYLRGEHEGEVTELDYIDDSDPSFILYHFTDGFKCNENFVSTDVNDVNAYNQNKILARIVNHSSKYMWRFDKQTIDMEHKVAIGKDGTKYEGADPYFFNKEGGQLHKKVEKVKAIPPTPFYGKFAEDITQYKKSYKDFQLEQLKQQNDNEPTIEIIVEETTNAVVEATTSASTITTTPVLPNIKNEIEDSTPKQKELTTKTEKPAEIENNKPKNSINEVINVLMQNAKFNDAEISFNIVVGLPDKSLIDVIKTNYPKSFVDDAFDYVINNLDLEDVKNAIRQTLKSFYQIEVEESTEDADGLKNSPSENTL